MTDPILQLYQLRKVFRVGFWGRRLTAVEGLTLEVRQGEVFGLLGPNGSGKSTTFKMLMGLIRPTSGEARLFGRPVTDVAARHKIGFLPESPYFYDYLTAKEPLRFSGQLFGMQGATLKDRIDDCCD